MAAESRRIVTVIRVQALRSNPCRPRLAGFRENPTRVRKYSEAEMIIYLLVVWMFILSLGGYFIMAAIDDLTTAVTGLEAASTMIINKINALKSTPGVDPVQVEALVARVNTVISNLTAAAQ
jgi:hypothetical protein